MKKIYIYVYSSNNNIGGSYVTVKRNLILESSKKISYDSNEIYQKWLSQNLQSHKSKSLFTYQYLKSDNTNKYIPMPPPNITGKLHMGHALFLTIQDSIIRFYKNKGNTCLWLPGLDHAGLATYEKISNYQNENQASYEKACIEICDKHKSIILEQISKMGALPDWDNLTYTLDSDYEDFTIKTLKFLFDSGRISFKEGQYYLDLKDYALKLKNDLENGLFNIIPKYEIKNLLPFLDNLELWNISRQIPWGTKLPFYIENEEIKFNINASSDSLDTWFNSSLWPIASLMKNPDLLDEFYPAELIETGSDILFFWCARMLMMSNFIYDNQEKFNIKLKSEYAFKTIYLHGIIRDKNGDKFSKSLGNGIDPLDMIAKYGADSTRLFIISRTGASEDIIFNEDLLPAQTKFMNKIWQSARFFTMYASKIELEKLKSQELKKDNEKLKEIQLKFGSLMDNYNFLEASRFSQSIFKEWFCDQWIEENKAEIQKLNQETILEGILILNQMIAIIEPFCPFIAHEIHGIFFDDG